VAFIIVFIFYLIFVIFNKKKVNKIFETYAALFIKLKFKVTFNQENPKKFAFIMALADSFICAMGFMIMSLFENIYIAFIIAVVVLIILILIVYSLIGLYYKKKEGKKNV